jgi:hypothetical protein
VDTGIPGKLLFLRNATVLLTAVAESLNCKKLLYPITPSVVPLLGGSVMVLKEGFAVPVLEDPAGAKKGTPGDMFV